MLVVRRSPFSGNLNGMDLPISQSQMDLWQSGVPIQNCMPHLTADEREFVMTGITAEEWNETFNVSRER